MPTFRYSTLMVANGTADPLQDWQYRYLPWPARIEHLNRSTLANVVQTITSGSETIVEESPVQAGGTIGVTPSPLNTPADAWNGAAGDLIKVRLRETAAGAPTVDGVIEVTPLI